MIINLLSGKVLKKVVYCKQKNSSGFKVLSSGLKYDNKLIFLGMDNYTPVIGKTYTLFGNSTETQPYYLKIKELTDKILHDKNMGVKDLLIYVHKASRNRTALKKVNYKKSNGSELSSILELLDDSLADYTPSVEEHLKAEPFYKCITDNTILSTREQYYLFMIEIELVNRLNKTEFLKSNYKIALLPYCLRETLTDCKAVPDELDYFCKKCVKECYVNKISTLLREHDIHPYIWRSIRLKSLMKQLVKKYGSTGIMGVACIVELAGGMRSCMEAGLPVIGLPLNANRCIRWMGDFYENSVDLDELRFLVS